MTQNQRDACASLAFNIGAAGFEGSTVVKRVNSGDVAGAANAFLLWCKPAALLPRRKAERLQFLKGAVPITAATAPRPPAHPPILPQPKKAQPMPACVAFFLALFGATAANAADVDFSPLVSAGVTYFVVPLLGAAATWLVGVIGVAGKKYLDQKTAALLAQNVDGVLQRAISYGATQAAAYIGSKDFHANVDGMIASYAAEYANSHAPSLMKQAGDVTQKVIARLADHPDALALKVAAQPAA